MNLREQFEKETGRKVSERGTDIYWTHYAHWLEQRQVDPDELAGELVKEFGLIGITDLVKQTIIQHQNKKR